MSGELTRGHRSRLKNPEQTSALALTSTTIMSDPHLPEIFDHIVDLLHDNRHTLEQCCLISKSWVPRTRRHLFVHVELRLEDQVELWKEMFPDPEKSPAYYTRSLKIIGRTLRNAGESGWITGFSRVEQLDFELIGRSDVDIPFATFSGTLSHSLRSLYLWHHSAPTCLQLHPFLPPSRESNLGRFRNTRRRRKPRRATNYCFSFKVTLFDWNP